MSALDDVPNSEAALFRPSKRRKVFRKRAEDDDQHDLEPATDANGLIDRPPPPIEVPQDAARPQYSDRPSGAMRVQRRPGAARKAGVGFSSAGSSGGRIDHTSNDTDSANIDTLVLERIEPTDSAAAIAANRFTAPTGQVVAKEDKHM